jgi:hypothetical protein
VPNVKAQVQIQNVSGLPRDMFVNTFYFSAVTLDEAGKSAMVQAIARFYRENASIGSNISSWWGKQVATDGHRIKLYDMTTQPTGPPVHDAPFSRAGTTTEEGLPNEIALCMSFYSVNNAKRNRGRVYLGPFKKSAAESTEDGDSRPASTLLTCIKEAGARLRSDMAGAWSVYSKADGAWKTVTNGWVNNAWDVQRRRGARESTRLVFL